MATTATRAIPFALASALLPGPRIRVVQVKARRAGLVELTQHAVETGHARGKRVIEVA